MDFLFPQSIESKDFFSLNKFSNKNYLPDDIYAEKFISLLEEPINCPINNKNILNPGTVINNNETQKSSKLTGNKKVNDNKSKKSQKKNKNKKKEEISSMPDSSELKCKKKIFYYELYI